MSTYLILKAIHGLCAVISFTLFFLRGIWTMRNSPIMQKNWVKKVPHKIDTVLLISALALAFTIQQYPFVDAWLTAKIIGLLLYIGLGMVALKFAKSNPVRLIAWLAAMMMFFYIVLVARTHNPLPFIH